MGGSIPSVSRSEVDIAETEKHLPDEDRPAFRVVQGKLNAAKVQKTTVQALCLIDKQQTKQVYLSHLLKDAVKSDQLNSSHVPVKITVIVHSYDSKDADFRRATTEVFQPFCSDYTYEPAYASLQIGDVALEWDETSLLLPQRLGDKPIKLATVTSQLAHHSETHLELSLTSDLLSDLADIVVKYNTKYHYGTLSCSSHYLVQDVLDALELPVPAAILTQIERHRQVLSKRKDKKEEFNSHKELDDYVKENVHTMDDEEKSYSRCHYTLFHHWGTLFPEKEVWRCDPNTCQLHIL